MREIAAGLWLEIKELVEPGARWRICAMASLSVVFSVLLALPLQLDNPWWAGISAFMSTQATRPGSLRRGALRIIGTVAGAAVGFLVMPWLAYDHVAGCLFILLFSTLGSLGALVSPHGNAWLFMGITANLVALSSLNEPLSALHNAVYRVLEVSVGTGVALLVAIALAPDAADAPAPPAPGWSDPLGRNWQAVMHALRAGLTVMVLPVVWSWFYLPSLTQMAITVTAVMAVPSFSGNVEEDTAVVLHRAFHRLVGCFLGGGGALILLATPLTGLFPWLAALGGGIWVCAHVQASQRGVGYIGTQAAVVFIITLVQGPQPPASITPGFDRMAGMTAGLSILLIVTALIWPDRERPDPEAATRDTGG